MTEAKAVSNMFNGLFIQETARAIHWSSLGTSLHYVLSSQTKARL